MNYLVVISNKEELADIKRWYINSFEQALIMYQFQYQTYGNPFRRNTCVMQLINNKDLKMKVIKEDYIFM